MALNLTLVRSRNDLERFVKFPWSIYKDDPYWVPPLIDEQIKKLDLASNPYWRSAGRELWIAWKGQRPVGTIAAIIDYHHNQVFNDATGMIGFFECIDDQQVADLLFGAATDWLKEKGMARLRGPFNPSPTDEIGVLVDGFNSRPTILEAHNPPYYAGLFEKAGFQRYNDLVARLYERPPDLKDVSEMVPEKLKRVVDIILKRKDLCVRSVNLAAWPKEVKLACQIYNAALSCLPDYLPVSEAEFMSFAESFRPILDPGMAMIAEIDGKAVGFALALPDINQAFQHVNGRLGLLGLIKLWWYSRKLSRVSFKILMVLPEFQNRGVEAALIYKVAEGVWAGGYTEVDMSLTGDENEKSNRFQQNLGFKVYRRYRIYERSI
jgi:GNAT superfamily N-acetyltransferase